MFDNLFLKSKHLFLANIFDDLDNCTKLKTQQQQQQHNKKEKKTNIYDKASILYKDFLAIYFDEYYELSNPKKNHDVWFKYEESTDTTKNVIGKD